MKIIKTGEISGYCFKPAGGNVEYVYLECVTREVLEDLRENETLTERKVEGDDMVFRDRGIDTTELDLKQ